MSKLRPLAPELAQLASEKLKEDPEKMTDALQKIKEWILQQQHLNCRTDDQWLAAYIRGCKFDVERVKTKLDLYYTCRNTARDYHRLHHKDSTFQQILKSGVYLPLPKLKDPAAPRVTIVRIDALDQGKLTSGNVLNALAFAQIIDKILINDDDNAIIAGNAIVIDMKNINLLLLMQLTPVQMRQLITSQQDAVPFATVKTFVMNVPILFHKILDSMKNLLDEENQSQFCLYTDNYEEMYLENEELRVSMPEEYGGNGGTLQEIIEHWIQKVDEYSEWLEEDLQFGTDEAKRPGRPKTADDMFGQCSSENFLKTFFGHSD